MLPSFAKQVIKVLRPVLVEDERGDLVPVGDVIFEVAGCLAQPGASIEFTDRRDTVQIMATLYAPPGADIRPGDRVKVDGTLFEVDGDPQQWRSPTGRISHTLAALKAWKG